MKDVIDANGQLLVVGRLPRKMRSESVPMQVEDPPEEKSLPDVERIAADVGEQLFVLYDRGLERDARVGENEPCGRLDTIMFTCVIFKLVR